MHPLAPSSFTQLYRDRLEAALSNAEIAEPAEQLSIPRERLESLVSEQRALALAGASHDAWTSAYASWTAASATYARERRRLEHPPLTVRVAVVVRTRLPRGAPFAAARERARRARIDALQRELDAARREAMATSAETTEILDEQAILPPLRAYIDERSDRAWSTRLTLSAEDAPGLAELRASPSVPLAGIDEVAARMRNMPGGSIGIAGPRGAGKTTLIRWFTSMQADPTTIGAYVSAPTRYDAREFLLHLFATVCSAVIGDTSHPDAWRDLSAGRRVARWLFQPLYPLLACLLTSVGLIATSLFGLQLDARELVGLGCLAGTIAYTPLAVLSWQWARDGRRALDQRTAGFAYALPPLLLAGGAGLLVLPQLATTTPAWAWGLVGAACSLALLAITWPRTWFELDEQVRDEARELLRAIRFQMTFTSKWSGTVKLPLLEGGLGGERSLASRPRSLPELVDELERFIRDAVATGRVVIGIDELDKMESERAAHRFLNEIKGVFGIRGCFFLVSVSEEAMSGFARRDARVRDAFDSAFDEIVYVRPLELAQSRTLLSERVIGLPTQFGALCHTLAGGLPRDLIRAARTVLACNPLGKTTRLSDVVRGVVVRELQARARAASIALRSFGPHATRFVDWLADVERAADALEATCTNVEVWERVAKVEDPVERARLTDLVLELQTFCYFALTLRDVFHDELDQDAFKALQGDPGPLELLARAHTTFSVNALLAWSEVSAFRRSNERTALDPPSLTRRTRRAATDGVASPT